MRNKKVIKSVENNRDEKDERRFPLLCCKDNRYIKQAERDVKYGGVNKPDELYVGIPQTIRDIFKTAKDQTEEYAKHCALSEHPLSGYALCERISFL